jgi:hypothetical protein
MNWRWRWSRMKRNADVEAARRSRIEAEEQWQREQQVTVRPLAEMYRENHIGPLLDRLVQKKVRGTDDPGTTGS